MIAYYAKDRAMDPLEDTLQIQRSLARNQLHGSVVGEDENNWKFEVRKSCSCNQRFDKAFCDGKDNCDTNP